MRVQPHFPSKPLLATVTSRSGLALSACSAANRPAPPEPRIKMSVLRRSRVIGCSEQARQQDERDDRRKSGRDRRKLFLFVAPSEILDHQQPQSSQQVHHEQEDETAFGKLDQQLIAPAQEAFQRRLAVNGETERQEMQRRKMASARPESRCTSAAIQSTLWRWVNRRAVMAAPPRRPRARRGGAAAIRKRSRICRRCAP